METKDNISVVTVDSGVVDDDQSTRSYDIRKDDQVMDLRKTSKDNIPAQTQVLECIWILQARH